MLISISKRFIFLANSKTGSTTIESMLKPHAELAWEGSPKAKHAPWIEVKAAFRLLFDHPDYSPEKFMRFGVIREPADWILSWYNYRRYRKNGGIPKDMSFEDFWRSDDWAKRISQASHFLDEDGQCRFNLIIPMNQLRGALPPLFQALGVEAVTEEVKNKSKGSLKKDEIPPGLWDEINEYYRADWLMHREWEEKFEREFPRVLEAFYGEGAEALPELQVDLRVAPKGPATGKKKAVRVAKKDCDYVELVKIVPPESRKALASKFVLKGAVLLKAGKVSDGCQLVVSDKAGERVIEWGLSSPRIAERFPNNPLAKSCRFKATGVHVGKGHPVTLLLSRPNGERHKLATISR